MRPIRKSELIQAVALRAGISQALARQSVDALLQSIAAELAHGRSVVIRGFGGFHLRQRAARTARDPNTGETLRLPPTRHTRFVPGARLRALVAQGAGSLRPPRNRPGMAQHEHLAQAQPGLGGHAARSADRARLRLVRGG